MSTEQPSRNPMALAALLTSLLPFITALAMLGTRFNIGPKFLVFAVAQVGGFVLFGLIVISSGLAVVALARSEGRRDWRIGAAVALQALSVAAILLFLKNT